MQYYRCKCGKFKAFGSMAPARCEFCEECGTTLEVSPSLHRQPIPHTYVTKYDQETGLPYEICTRCGGIKESKMSQVFETNDLVVPRLQFPDPCPVRVEITGNFVFVRVGQRDWQWRLSDGAFIGSGVRLEPPVPFSDPS